MRKCHSRRMKNIPARRMKSLNILHTPRVTLSHQPPDAVLLAGELSRLAEERHLVVDAKVSLAAYEEYSSSEDEELRKEAIKRHMASVRAHIKGLSEKNYQDLY